MPDFPTDPPPRAKRLSDPQPEDEKIWPVRCVACRDFVDVGGEDIGHTVECPLCGERFTAGADPEGLPRHPGSPSSPRGYDEDDEYEDRGHRRSKRDYLERNRHAILAKARVTIAKSANGLMWTGASGTVFCVILGVGCTVGAILADSGPNMGGGSIMLFIYAGLFGGVGSILHLLIAIAGFQMKKLRSKAWGYAAGGLGIATILLWGIVCPFTWAGMAYGIMALIAMGKPEVRDAFAINRVATEDD